MYELLHPLQPQLEQQMTTALMQHALENRGTFPPFQIANTAKAFAKDLISPNENIAATARTIGMRLGQMGMGLPSILAAQTTALEILAHAGLGADAIAYICKYFDQIIQSLVAADIAELAHQQSEMEKVYTKATNERLEQEARLRQTISALSTPIIPVYEGILVLPLVGTIDSRRASEVTERLLVAIADYQADFVILDITGVPIIDTSSANLIIQTARAVGLLGSNMVLVGIGAEIAQTIVHLGIELENLVTLANLQAGITYALERIGLGIQPLRSKKATQALARG